MDRTTMPAVQRLADAQEREHLKEIQVARKLDPTRFVVIGEGLAAGMSNFSLFDVDQRESFGAQMARQMEVDFPQPLIQPPGLGHAPGFPRLPVRHPFDLQTTVLCEFPPSGPVANVSVPGMTVANAVGQRPSPPLIRQGDADQTAVNFILGMPGILNGEESGPTALEYALQRKPTLAVIELGFAEVLEAATNGRTETIPDATSFRATYSGIVAALRQAGSEVIVTTIPDPMDTAHFSTLEAASRVVKMPVGPIQKEHSVSAGDRITVNGLMELGEQFMAWQTLPLSAGATLRATAAAEITRLVQGLNQAIAALAEEHGATVCDLAGLFRRLNRQGIVVGARRLTADYLGGFYSLNGYYPGKTGQALIANELLTVVNRAYDKAFEPVNAAAVMATDPVADYRLADGPEYRSMAGLFVTIVGKMKEWGGIASFLAKAVVDSIFREKEKLPAGGNTPERWTLKLPTGLTQELPINKEASYYGDSLVGVHTTDPSEAEYGISGRQLFGGLAMLDTNLNGTVKIKFSEPANNITHFEVTHGLGLKGDDSKFSAPQFYRLTATGHQVMDSAKEVSSGDLDLVSGEVTNLKYRFYFLNSALLSLVAVNPSLPKEPLRFPGEYGSTWAAFEQRPDGKLDYTCYATTFIPLSVLKVPIRFPLPFAGPNGSFASIPAEGSSLHPHIRISTKPPEPKAPGVKVPEIPTNTIRVFTTSVHNNSFGDDFSLNHPDLGGPTKGRSHLVGRLQIQFGERFGNFVPIALSALPPGGLLRTLEQSPLAGAFKHRIADGLMGHDETLQFPKSAYKMNSVTYLDDVLDIALGAVDVRTGKILGPFLRRGIITTNWLLAMVRIETRTPKATFQFRGDASIEEAVNGAMVFRYHGKLHIPFPENYKFPKPDLENHILIEANSALDPFLRWQAMCEHGQSPSVPKSGGAEKVKASMGDEFSYSYSIPGGSGKASFEYVNHTKKATFRMEGLLWSDLINSSTSTAAKGDFDTISFAGIGTWSPDPDDRSHVATVQVCTSPRFPYVTIMVDGGRTSSVNTKPQNVDDTMP